MSLDPKPGQVNFAVVKHDDGCPTLLSGNGFDCECNPTMELVKEKHWVDVVVRDRKARRKAEREAAKAMRKAARGTR